jgi:uncharacterized SAM-binding protein YcdF (DUF218 family)
MRQKWKNPKIGLERERKRGCQMGKKTGLSKKQIIFLTAALLMLLSGVAGGLRNAGAWLLLLGSGLLGSGVLLERKMGRNLKVFSVLAGLLLVGLFLHAVIWNYFAFGRQPEKSGEATVIVLGCKVNGDSPSLMLRRRLLCARDYLLENPQAKCIVSGGLGENESYSEAYVMKKFLTENGIDAQRIYEEDRSVNTDTNIRYSLEIVRDQGLSPQLILCTDGFHQLRAWIYVRRNGMNALAISGKTPLWVIPSYAVRELAGILKMILLG